MTTAQIEAMPAAHPIRKAIHAVIEAEERLRAWRPMSSAPVPVDRARRRLALELAIREAADVIYTSATGLDGIDAINARAGRLNSLARLDAGRHLEAAIEIKTAAAAAMLAELR